MAEAFALAPTVAAGRLRLRVRGVVQGVGFRPFVYTLAQRLGLSGHVLNDADGVLIEIEGERLDKFVSALRASPPPLARIESIEVTTIAPAGSEGFEIRESRDGPTTTRIGADAAICADCLEELLDPSSRHFHHPFVNCTHCGPRYTITRALPYDRAETAMAPFPLCPACRRDYEDPADRRFHAEAISCPACGPRIDGDLAAAARLIRAGGILALKGVGGFHLVCDAFNEAAVAELRRRKSREAKPFAVMVENLAAAERLAHVSTAERQILDSPASPVVILRPKLSLAPSIAPSLDRTGVMLAYTPLHHLLFAEIRALAGTSIAPIALVATSANPGGEPIVFTNTEALARLGAIADMIIGHDRDIVVRTDDSVVRMIAGAPSLIRRARGYVPEPVDLGSDGPSVIALGADLKNTVCITRGREAFLSQHVGGLDNAATIAFQRETVDHLLAILDVRPEAAACDLHPDFRSTRLAESLDLPLIRVQHHLAHLHAVAAEHRLSGPFAGLALDGFGFGADGTAWGGEMITANGADWQRVSSLVPISLPGGDKAAIEPWRMGLAVLERLGRLDDAAHIFPNTPAAPSLAAMMARGMRNTTTSSLGRLFDAAAAFAGFAGRQAYEGQAAMELEALADNPSVLEGGWAFEDGRLDLMPLFSHILARGLRGRDVANLFHGTLAAALADWTARNLGLASGPLVLGGGCLLNDILATRLSHALDLAGQQTLLPRAIPANDGGIALGQAAYARHVLAAEPLKEN